jgi:Zn-dependent protease
LLLSVDQLLLRAGACLIITTAHGAALAVIACALGDRGPQFDGRLTLNPLSHLDILGALAMVLSQIGWISPMAIDPGKLRLGRLGLVVCVVAGLAVTLAVTELMVYLRIAALETMPMTLAPSAVAMLDATSEMGPWFVAFNLLPVPPLTGANLLIAIHPPLTGLLAPYRFPMSVLVTAVVLLDVIEPIVRPIRDVILYVLPAV